MPKLGINVDGFDSIISRFERIGVDAKPITEKAIKESHKLITAKAEQAIATHKATGRTQKSLQKECKVKWSGTVAESDVGFDISGGGLPSIFLMYGTPRMGKDAKFYQAFYNKATQNEVANLQEGIFYSELAKYGG